MVGAGATGGYYGGRMAQAGRDITFLVRGTRLQQLQERGLEIVSPQGDTTVHQNDCEQSSPCPATR